MMYKVTSYRKLATLLLLNVGLMTILKPAMAGFSLQAAGPLTDQNTEIQVIDSTNRSSSVQWVPDTKIKLADFYQAKSLSFYIKAEDAQKSSLNIKLDCGRECSGQLNIEPWLTVHSDTGWHHLSIPVNCFNHPEAQTDWPRPTLTFERIGNAKVFLKDISMSEKVTTNYACTEPELRAITPAPLNTYWAKSWWKQRHQQKLLEKINIDPELILIGDSITHGWERKGKAVWQHWFADIKTLNLGFSGDRTENVLWRLQNGEVDGLNPELVVIMIGTNNTGHRMEAPEYIAKGIEQIVRELKKRLPESQILLLDIFPRGEEPNHAMRVNNAKTNARLNELGKKYDLLRANFNPAFLNNDQTLSKEIMPDWLHPNEKGYQIWATKLAPYFKKYLAD